jgi:hypothetical protein
MLQTPGQPYKGFGHRRCRRVALRAGDQDAGGVVPQETDFM